MATETAKPAEAAQPAPAASTSQPAAETKPSAGSNEVKGAAPETKVAATPETEKKADAAQATTLLGKKLPPAEPAKEKAEGSKEAEKLKADEYEVTLPKESLLGADHAKVLTAEYRKLGLSKDQAQAMASQVDATVKGYVEAQVAKLNETEAGWWSELQADKKYGGDYLEQSNQHATTALDRFFPGLKEDLVNSPYAAHPKLFRGLVELGKMVADPKFRVNGLPLAAKESLTPAQKTYGVNGEGRNVVQKGKENE